MISAQEARTVLTAEQSKEANRLRREAVTRVKPKKPSRWNAGRLWNSTNS